MLGGGISGCAYEHAGDPPPAATAERSGRPAPTVPTKGPEILDVEAANYVELERRLAVARGSVILDEAGPADGPGVGFSQTATVESSGTYTVTAACVGMTNAQIFLSLPETGREPLALNLNCSGVLSQVIELREGHVGAALIRPDPTGPWTGAVAGVRITAE